MKNISVYLAAVSLINIIAPIFGFADETPFYPTWKHLDSNSKQLYVSGYLHGLRDAEEVVGIAREYVEKNPALALQTLEKVRKICAVADISAGALVPELDSFYSNIENQETSFSSAIGIAQQKVRATR